MATEERIESSVSKLVDELYNNEADVVKEVIRHNLKYFLWCEVEDILDESESPIEKAFGLELRERLKFKQFGDSESFIEVQQQRKIDAGGKLYRVDFLLELINPTDEEIVRIVIECDGFDYHDRTKEQATRDKKRDRDLMLKGYRVMRFTGSEIHKSVGGCVTEIIKACYQLTNHWRRK